jgi:hypothetical protein
MRNAVLVDDIEVVAVNEYVTSNVIADVNSFVIAVRSLIFSIWFVSI